MIENQLMRNQDGGQSYHLYQDGNLSHPQHHPSINRFDSCHCARTHTLSHSLLWTEKKNESLLSTLVSIILCTINSNDNSQNNQNNHKNHSNYSNHTNQNNQRARERK
jgi:hypothetical protein